jgi:hypothetical protein
LDLLAMAVSHQACSATSRNGTAEAKPLAGHRGRPNIIIRATRRRDIVTGDQHARRVERAQVGGVSGRPAENGHSAEENQVWMRRV